MSTLIDPGTPFGETALKRLFTDEIGWVTTVSHDGTPQPNPVWFLWTDDTILLFSKPASGRIANLRDRHVASFNLDTNDGHVIVLTGTGEIVDQKTVTAEERAAYDDKYAEGYKSLGTTAAQFHTDYSVAQRITPQKIRGW